MHIPTYVSRIGSKTGLFLALLGVPAVAAESGTEQGIPQLGLSPGEPQVRSATPQLPFGVRPAESKENVLDFHGYLLLPAHAGFHKRPSTTTGQSGTVLHSPPLVPQYLRSFEYTGALPSTWVQFNFVYGNQTVYATAVIAGTAAMDGAGYFDPTAQMGVSDAFVTANLTKSVGFPFLLRAGAMTGRYGAMGAWDAGRYATPLIARTNAIGENIVAGYQKGNLYFVFEHGLGGQNGRPPAGMAPMGYNDFMDANVGASFVHHAHLGATYDNRLKLGLHYLTAWTQDDQVLNGTIPDGRITVAGSDVHVAAGRAGHLFVGGTYTKATNAGAVSSVIEVLNARGGPELVANYLGAKSGGNGSLTTFGAQYDLSVSRLVYGDLYTGMSPDVMVSLFGIATKVKSNDKDYDGVLKLKAGVEASYFATSWFGVSERFDHVRLDNSDSKKAFTSLTSRLLFHTNWKSRDELALQYSYYLYGADVLVRTGYPAAYYPDIRPDKHVLSLVGTYWW